MGGHPEKPLTSSITIPVLNYHLYYAIAHTIAIVVLFSYYYHTARSYSASTIPKTA